MEPDLPPDVFTFPSHCSCRQGSVSSHQRQSGRRSKSSERLPSERAHAHQMWGYLGYCPQGTTFSPHETFRLKRRNSSLENLNQIFAQDETSDKPKENRIVKFHDEAPGPSISSKDILNERGRST